MRALFIEVSLVARFWSILSMSLAQLRYHGENSVFERSADHRVYMVWESGEWRYYSLTDNEKRFTRSQCVVVRGVGLFAQI